jgi:hypothetical protein
MLNATYAMLAVLPIALWVGRVRDGAGTTSARHSSIAESSTSTIDPDALMRRATNDELATMGQRLRAKRAAKRREYQEFRVWLQITAKPL